MRSTPNEPLRDGREIDNTRSPVSRSRPLRAWWWCLVYAGCGCWVAGSEALRRPGTRGGGVTPVGCFEPTGVPRHERFAGDTITLVQASYGCAAPVAQSGNRGHPASRRPACRAEPRWKNASSVTRASRLARVEAELQGSAFPSRELGNEFQTATMRSHDRCSGVGGTEPQ